MSAGDTPEKPEDDAAPAEGTAPKPDAPRLPRWLAPEGSATGESPPEEEPDAPDPAPQDDPNRVAAQPDDDAALSPQPETDTPADRVASEEAPPAGDLPEGTAPETDTTADPVAEADKDTQAEDRPEDTTPETDTPAAPEAPATGPREAPDTIAQPDEDAPAEEVHAEDTAPAPQPETDDPKAGPDAVEPQPDADTRAGDRPGDTSPDTGPQDDPDPLAARPDEETPATGEDSDDSTASPQPGTDTVAAHSDGAPDTQSTAPDLPDDPAEESQDDPALIQPLAAIPRAPSARFDDDDDIGDEEDWEEAAEVEDFARAAGGDAFAAAPRRRIRKLHIHVGAWTLVAIAIAAGFLMLASMSLTGRVVVLPRFVSEQLLDRMNAAMPSGSFTLRQVEFGVTPKGRPSLRLVDVGVRDATGLELAQINGVESGFRFWPALTGTLEPTVVRLQGAQVTLRRLSDGSLALSFGTDIGATGDLAALLDQLDGALTNGPLRGSELVEASDLTITLEDSRAGRLWQVTDGQLKITQTDAFVDTTVSFDVFNQTEQLAHTTFGFRSAKASSEASVSASFQNAAAPDIAAQAPALAFLSVFDAPISGALRASFAADGGLSEFAGALTMGSGALLPAPGAPPAAFDGAKVYLTYDPAQHRLDLLGAQVTSEIGTAEGEGRFYLGDFRSGLPNSLVGQVTLTRGHLAPTGYFAAPLDIDRGVADFRIKLDPFTVDIGQAVAFRGSRRYQGEGQIAADETGWTASVDATAAAADRNEILALWPLGTAAKQRDWFESHVLGVEVRDAHLAFRKAPGETMQMYGTYPLTGGRLLPLATLPPLDIATGYVTQGPNEMSVTVESGTIASPDGGKLDISGSSYRIPSLKVQPQEGEIQLALDAPLESTLALLSLEPFHVFRGSSLGAEVVQGHAKLAVTARFPLGRPHLDLTEVDLSGGGTLTDVRSDKLVPDRLLLADSLDLSLSNTAVDLSGTANVGRASANGSWHLPIGAAANGSSSVSGTMEISDRTLAEFNISLPDAMLTGAGPGHFSLDFARDETPRLSVVSDLRGVGLSIPGTGWRKPAATAGKLELAAVLGQRPEVTSLSLTAPGLSATGRVSTAEGGGLGVARFDRVKLGGWFDGAVTVTGRGAGVPVAIAVTSGRADMRKADLGSGGGGSGARGPKQPFTLALDRLIVSENIVLTGLKGDFDLSGGLRGTFQGGIAGGGPVSGTVAPQDGRSAFRIVSQNAGAALKGAGIYDNARGGTLELILAPVGGAGTYEGDFTIKDVSVVNSPAMLELVSAVSIVGMLDQASGEGIKFTDVSGRFRLTPTAVTLYRSSAVGVSMGISLDGYYNLKEGTLDMQGVLSPLYLVNALGRIFSPRDGEGLIGFNFTVKGPYNGPDVQVNPLSILTPGAFREIFRRPAPEAPANE